MSPVEGGPVSGEPVRVGLVGAGPWARLVHAPMLAAGPETELVGVWARRQAAAAELGVPVFGTFAALLDACEAVAFAVPPDVQVTMGIEAARAGKAVLLEKPIAFDVAAAERLAGAVTAAGVASLVVLTARFSSATDRFLTEAASLDPVGGRAWFVSGALLGGWFSTPWRLERGVLLDLGPHAVDLLDAALGPVVAARAHGDPRRWVGLLLDHESGAVSEVSLSGSITPDGRSSGASVYGRERWATIDTANLDQEWTSNLRSTFADLVRHPRPHPLDVQRGLYLQRILGLPAGV